ncbi:MAG: hypothetical protein IIZ40_01150 [Bacilli bacterium]|nr:hypothetical protein [Bacilli bacterium]
METFMKYLAVFLSSYFIIFIIYYLFVVGPVIRSVRVKDNKKKKEKKLIGELILLRNYYGVDIEKVGIIKVMRTLSFVNPLILSLMATLVFPFKQGWLRILILVLIILPIILGSYYLLMLYFKKIERKNDNV